MFKLINKYKREFVYISYLFLILELLITPTFAIDIKYFSLTAIIGYILINIWLINTFRLGGFKKVSKYSSALIKVNVFERLFSYVLLPLTFYTSIVIFLLFSSSIYLNQVVIVISLILFFFLLLFVRTSYEKVYSVNKTTRVVYEFISVATFFLITSVILKIGLGDIYSGIIIFILSLISFIYIFHHHRKLDLYSLIIGLILSTAFLLLIFAISSVGIYTKTAILSIIYYLFVAMINVRFNGGRSISEYIPPLMYAVMALILVLNM